MTSKVIEFILTAKNKLSKPMGRASGAVKGLGRAVFSLKGAIAGVGIGLLAKQFIETASKTEQLNVRLRVLLGSVEEGNRLFKDMTQFASEVPFEFEEIMESSTALAGVMEGGVDEIREWMPLIGDLAATTGLGIQETTEQVQRMLSAGAASADKFRERGITAMLGFQAGVSVSAEETKKRLMEAWVSPTSRFRGATEALRTTWKGLLSMISDKWFAIKTIIMDAGVMDFLKAIAMTINDDLGKGLNTVKANAKGFADAFISGGFKILDVIGAIANTFKGVRFAISVANLAFKGLAFAFIEGWNLISKSYIAFRRLLDEDYKPPTALIALEQAANLAKSAMGEAKEEMDNIALSPMPSDAIDAFKERVVSNMNKIKEAARQASNEVKGVTPEERADAAAQAEEKTLMEKNAERNFQAMLRDKDTLKRRILNIADSLLSETELQQLKYEQDILDLQNFYMQSEMTEEQHNEMVQQLTEDHQRKITQLTKDGALSRLRWDQMTGFQRVQFMVQMTDKIASTGAQGNKKMFKLQKAAAITNAVMNAISMAQSGFATQPFFPVGIAMGALAIAIGVANVSKIKSQKYAGQAHAGLTNVPNEGTYLLQRGERVIQPSQNKDLTQFLNGGEDGQNNQGTVTIENLNISVLENATNADALLAMSSTDIEEVIASKLIPGLNVLARKGILQDAITQGEIG